MSAQPNTFEQIRRWRDSLYDGSGIPTDPTHWLTQLCYELRDAGVFEDGIDSDRKGRGRAINIAVTDRDEAEKLAILQVREARFRPGRYTRVRKDYYLIGRIETGAPFAHPITELATARTTVRQALAKIWDCDPRDLDDIERQGDIALIPVRHPPANAERITDDVILRDSHRLRGEVYRAADGTYYTRGRAWLVHLRGEHPTVTPRSSGWRRVQLALRGRLWGHSSPTAD
ncbi:MAG: hypothetical protein QJR02_10275 [Sinobacteraceae bacterium]|nr:hypothetical protein [Nevskiaceae bacterium]